MFDRTKGWLVGILVVASFVTKAAHTEPPDDIRTPAVFRVTTNVVNANLIPFTATISGFGNTLINEGAGFEPVVFRNKLIALVDAPNRIVADPAALSYFDVFREGFLDQATVHIYRIENGRFRMVREDRVKAGGSHASGWFRAIGDDQIIASGVTSFRFRWDNWNRPGAKYAFTVRAIDRYGNLSAIAPPLEINSPEQLARSPTVQNTFAAFKPARAIFPVPEQIPAPKNLRGRLGGDGILTLEWEPVDSPVLAGYVVYRSDYTPARHSGYYLDLASAPMSADQHVKSGDMIIVSKKIYSPSRIRDLSNRVWDAWIEKNRIMPGLVNFFPDEHPDRTWSLVPHSPKTPVEEPGETCLKLQLAAGATESLAIYNHGGTGQYWYDVLEKTTYTVEVWLRQEGNGTARFKFTGFYDRAPQKIQPIVFDVGQGWKKYVAQFKPSVILDGAGANMMALEFTGPSTFYVDNFRVYQSDTPYLALLPDDREAVKSSGVSALRTHGLIKTGVRTYNMEQLTESGGVISGTQKLNTLPQILAMMRKVGVQPWLQVEFHMAPREWLAFVEYMAAPYDPNEDTPAGKPWAYKRYRQGQAKPWVEEFDRIYFELSNETWNSLFTPWTFSPMTDAVSKKHYSAGAVYGLFQEYVHSIMRSSPYWQAAVLDRKLIFVLGGQTVNLGYGRDAALASPSTDFLTIAAYNGGWDEAEDPPEWNAAGLFSVLAHVNQSAIPVAKDYKERFDLMTRGAHRLRLGTYEAGPGYALNGLNNARVTEKQAHAQEQVMKSLAAGTATLDSFLARAYRGFEVQNFFTFDRGTLWKSHAKWYRGGQAYPSWKLLALFNNVASGGDMLRTETLSVPSTDLGAFIHRREARKAPLAAVYAIRKTGRYGLFVISRKVPNYPVSGDDGYTPVSIELPFNGAKSVTLYRMTGDPGAHNLSSDNIRIEKLEMPAAELGRRFSLTARTGADERGLPPASTFLYIFDGVKTDDGVID